MKMAMMKMNPKKIIEMFPDDTRRTRIRQMIRRQRMSDSRRLMLLLILAAVVALVFVVLFILGWSLTDFDTSPITGLIIVVAGIIGIFIVEYRRR